MKAVIITRHGGPKVLQVQDVPSPNPASGEELIHAEAGGLNFADTMTMRGGYPGTPKPPLVAGREFCGKRESNGERVMGYMQWGAFAETVAAKSAMLWPVPTGWSAEEGAAFPVNFFTAYFAYWKAGLLDPTLSQVTRQGRGNQVQNAKTPRVLIHAVAGGVGTAAVQIGKLLGMEMYGTSSSEEKIERVKKLGLQHAINYKQQDYEEAIRELTHGEGVNAVFEMLGGEHTAKSVRCLSNFGRVIVYGSASGQRGLFDPGILYAKGASVHGLWLTYLSANRGLMNEAWDWLSARAAEGALRPVIGSVFPIAKTADAYVLLTEGRNFGKVVLKI
jgi:NADPH:quinone reductase-like Zn-dependent oxidoreductase